jgi:hypothetical protein
MGVRRYDPSAQRFLQLDQFQGALDDLTLATDPLTQNRYGLAASNPLSGVEWDGHVPTATSSGTAATSPNPGAAALARYPNFGMLMGHLGIWNPTIERASRYPPPVHTGNLISEIAGVGGGLISMVDFGMALANPPQGARDIVTGNTLSDKWRRWVRSQGVSTSKASGYQGGEITPSILMLGLGGIGAASKVADVGLAARSAAGARFVVGSSGVATDLQPVDAIQAALARHAANAVARLASQGLTRGQIRAAALDPSPPSLTRAFEGERMDTFVKESVLNDDTLNLDITGRS